MTYILYIVLSVEIKKKSSNYTTVENLLAGQTMLKFLLIIDTESSQITNRLHQYQFTSLLFLGQKNMFCVFNAKFSWRCRLPEMLLMKIPTLWRKHSFPLFVFNNTSGNAYLMLSLLQKYL